MNSIRTVYVGDLSPLTTELDLISLFGTQGTLQSVKLISGNQPYAYINYKNTDDALKAVETLNYAILHRAQIRVMLFDPKDKPKLKKYNVIVKNLPSFVDNRGLNDTFSVFGDVLSSKVVTDQDGNSKGFGYVCYKDKAAMKKAIALANGTKMDKNVLKVARHEKKEERLVTPKEIIFTNTYIKNFDFKEEQLLNLMRFHGEVTSFHFPKNQDDQSVGFAFCNFRNPEDAKKAVDSLHNLTCDQIKEKFPEIFARKEKIHSAPSGVENISINGSMNRSAKETGAEFNSEKEERGLSDSSFSHDHFDLGGQFEQLSISSSLKEPFYIQRAQAKNERHEQLKESFRLATLEGKALKRNLYVVNLPASTTEDDIKDFFSIYGLVTNYKLKTDTSTGLKFAYVCYSTPEEADLCMKKANDKVFDGHKIVISYFKTKKERDEEKLMKNEFKNYNIEKPKLDRRNIGGDLYGMVLAMADYFQDDWVRMGVENEYAFADRVTKLLMEKPFNEVRNMISLGDILSHNIMEIMKDLEKK